MEDAQIVALYQARDEQALKETDAKYGSYCFAIAFRILQSEEDARECVNDAYLHAWQAIPPHEPTVLSTFLGKLTRYASLHKWRDARRLKRGGGEVTLVLDELTECVPSAQSVEDEIDGRELTALLNRFLAQLDGTERRVFLCRYWYMKPVKEIASQQGFSESKVKSMLLRTRKKLRKALEKEGVVL